jgi:glutaconate CoA-transferase subunit A
MGVFPESDKKMSLEDAAKLVKDGDIIAFGGALSVREPIAFIRELIRQRVKDLHTVGTAHGFDIDLAVGGGIVKYVQNTYVGFEFDFGLAPNFRRAVEKGEVISKEDGCNSLIYGLRAAALGVPFLPHLNFETSDIMKLHPEFKKFKCPITGQTLIAIPALEPDVTVLHARIADKKGNTIISKPYVADILMARASKKVVVTAEKVVDRLDREPHIPYFEVTAVVEVPYGAHPTALYPDYTYDKDHMGEYVRLARDPDNFQQYLDKYVFGPKSHEEYLELIDIEKITNWKTW